MKAQMFGNALRAVSTESEIPPDVILSGDRHTETVDARSILVRILFSEGFRIREIAECVNITPRGVSFTLTTFDDRIRQSKMMKMIYGKVRSNLEVTKK